MVSLSPYHLSISFTSVAFSTVKGSFRGLSNISSSLCYIPGFFIKRFFTFPFFLLQYNEDETLIRWESFSYFKDDWCMFGRIYVSYMWNLCWFMRHVTNTRVRLMTENRPGLMEYGWYKSAYFVPKRTQTSAYAHLVATWCINDNDDNMKEDDSDK